MSSRAQHELLPYGSYFNFNIILEPYLINFHSIPFQKTNTKCILSILKKKTKAPAKQNVCVWSFSRLNKKKTAKQRHPWANCASAIRAIFLQLKHTPLSVLPSQNRALKKHNKIVSRLHCNCSPSPARKKREREKKKTFGDKVSSYPFPPP